MNAGARALGLRSFVRAALVTIVASLYGVCAPTNGWAEVPHVSTVDAAESATVAAPTGDLAARMSAGGSAMEYWDLTAWLTSGHRVFARFLVTNQGPGVRTAAAVGHVVLADGTIVPFKWGRRSDDWTLGEAGRRLKIAKAALDVGGPTVILTVDGKKQGVRLRLEVTRAGPLLALRPLGHDYGVDVVMPAPVHGQLWARGMDAAREVSGAGAVTHAWTERPEADVLSQRLEAFGRDGDLAVYVSAQTSADGMQRSTLAATRAGDLLARADDVAVELSRATATAADPAYPVPARWHLRSGALAASIDVRREVLRWDPLEIIPQPFRALMALGGRPQRVWSDATIDVALTAPGETAPVHAHVGGIAAATFARPLPSAR